MPQANFGSGDLIIIPPSTDADITPVRVGVLQEVSLDYSSTIAELMGGAQFPYEVGNGPGKLTGKAKFGKFTGRQLSRFIAGSTISTGGKLEVIESGTVTAGAVTVSGSAQFVDNLGVYDSSGTEYKQVANSPTGSQYSVAAGVYTFNVSENTKVLQFRYTKTQATGSTITLGNPSMGIATKFKVMLFNTYTANSSKVLAGELFAVVFPKLSIPFKNTDFSIPDLDFQCLADDTNGTAKFYIDT